MRTKAKSLNTRALDSRPISYNLALKDSYVKISNWIKQTKTETRDREYSATRAIVEKQLL